MRHLSYFLILSYCFVSCRDSNHKIKNLITSFGEQPSISKNISDKIEVVFGNEESIYYSSSKNQGDSFSEPSLVAKHEGLVLGFSSGPGIATTSTSVVVTAPDKLGDLYAWSRPIDTEVWSGPFRINDVENSVGESLSDITSTPDGRFYCVWIDTRFLEQNGHEEHSVSKPKNDAIEPVSVVEDLNEITPIGITKGELYKKIGDVPKNAHLAFHDDNNGNLYWVFFDKDKKVLKAENYEEYKKFRERNGDRVKPEGKIYLASSHDGGKTWSKSKMIYRSPDGSVCECCKPSIISDNDGNLIVMFRNNINGSRDLHFTKTIDGGKTFSIPEKLGSGTWKINGCPMDGGGLTVNSRGELKTIWKRKGDVYISNSSSSEERIGEGRSPSISANDQKTYVVFSQGEDIISTTLNNSSPTQIGIGFSPKVIALKNGAIYFWVNSDGINFKKVL